MIVENNSVPMDVRVWAEALAAKEYGYDVSVICPIHKKSGRKKYERLEGVDIYRHPMPLEASGFAGFFFEYMTALLWEFIFSIKLYLKKPFHIIHSANPPDHIFIIAGIFKLFGVKYIFDHHDITPETYVAKFGKKNIVYKILLCMEKVTFKMADIVISTNESYKKIAIERGGKKSEDVFVVRNGPDLAKIDRPAPNPKLKEGFEYLVAYLGNINNQEGIDNLLRSVAYIVFEKKINNIRFMIIGTGPHWNEMVQMSKKMKLENFVTFTGYIPYADLYEILTTADLCVNPEFRNPFTDKSTMIKIMDYMTFGKPIVMYETTEGRVSAGESAYYVKNNNEQEFADAIVELLADPARRNKMSEKAIERINGTLQWSMQKQNLHAAYTHLDNHK
ncbi:MAG: glycosyltransferase family 4 protein [Syntrophales bacterium]|jgi:glycosyltransferase involved in cell wall biosynthesis|nr:glycosyltransferase family 4 protein [Syntrophales bacterium]